MPSDRDSLPSSIRKILLEDWDPHSAAANSAAHAAYDGYVPPLLDLLRSHPPEEAVVEFLHEREKESMCFPSLGTQRLRRVARKLLDINTEVT